MSQYDDEYENNYDDFEEENFGPEEVRPRTSTGTKILIGILIFCGVCVIACCGGVFWFANKAFDQTEKPAEVLAMADSIASIDIPEVYKPTVGVTANIPIINVSMEMTVFARTPKNPDEGAVMLMSMSAPGMENDQQLQQQFEAQMEQQGHDKNIIEESSEIKTFTIDGNEIAFEFIKGKDADSNEPVRQVNGMFPGRKGMAFLVIHEPEETWDEAQVTQMIESISTD